MQTRILKSKIDEIAENANWDTGDHSWWVRDRIDQAIDATLELINDNLMEKDQIVIVPEEAYLKCECQFKPKMVDDKYGYREIYVHTSYCKEHENENPELYNSFGHRKDCPCCGE